MKQTSEKERLEAGLYFVDKQHSHAAKAFGVAKTQHDRELAKKEVDSLSQKIIALRERIKSLVSK